MQDIELEKEAFGIGYMMVRKDLLESIGGFDPSYLTGEDLEFLFRVRGKGHIIKQLAEISILRRIHNNNLSADLDANQRSIFKMVKTSIRRKKGSQLSNE